MVPMIRSGILAASGATNDPNEDFSGECEVVTVLSSNLTLIILSFEFQSTNVDLFDDGNNRNQYHIGILKHVQAIFAHLGHSALQFYVPRGLWSHFKYAYTLQMQRIFNLQICIYIFFTDYKESQLICASNKMPLSFLCRFLRV